MPNLAWGITGASEGLVETFDEVEQVAGLDNVRVTTFITQAGVELVKHFRLQNRLAAISNGEAYREIAAPRIHGATTHLATRFFAGEYQALVVAPCTSNTLCKFSAGICDTPVTNAAMWAVKGGVSVFILQTHITMGHVESPLFVRIKDALCRRCDVCQATEICPVNAIARKKDKYPRIHLMKCVRCGECVSVCPYDAIATGEKFRLNRRIVDQEASERVGEIKGMAVLTESRQVGTTLKRYAAEPPKGIP